MKIIVFGAAGTVGKHLVKQSLQEGHQVTGFVRDLRNGLSELSHPNLHLFEGDVLDRYAVRQVMDGHDAVICVLGAGRKGGVRAPGTRNIIEAMEQLGIKRFICQSTLGAGDSRENLNFIWKHIMFGWYLREAYEDHQLQEKWVMASNLDWILVRPGALTDGPLTGKFKHGFSANERSIKLKISRADVAMFLLKQLKSDQYIRQAPGLSY